MGANPPKEITRRREERAWELRIGGHRLAQIADRLEAEGLGRISVPAVHQALGRVEARLLAGLGERVKAERLRNLSALWHLYDEAMQAWERSKGQAKRASKRTVEGGKADAARTETAQELRERDGDPEYLRVAQGVLADIRKLLGLNAPEKAQIGGLPGAPPLRVEMDLSGVPTDVLEQFESAASALQAAMARPVAVAALPPPVVDGE